MYTDYKAGQQTNNFRQPSTHMLPVAVGSGRQFLPSFHQQHTCITDLSGSMVISHETLLKVYFISLAVCESRAGRLGTAYTAAIDAAVDLRLVKAEHSDFCRPSL